MYSTFRQKSRNEPKQASFVRFRHAFPRLKHTLVPKSNKPGTAQVGAISKAQVFKKQLLETFANKNFFSKKIFEFFFENSTFKSRTRPKNSKRSHSGSLNVFTNRKRQKNARGYLLIETENFRKKSRIVPKKTKQKKPNEKNLWSRIYFWKHKICG